MKKLLMMLSLLLPVMAAAEGGSCPPGYYPIGGAGAQGCAPMASGGGAESVGPIATGTWETRWGAIAEDKAPSPGRPLATGSAISQKSKRAANALALDVCKSQGGNKCSIRLSYHNQCAALADPGTDSGVIAGGVSIASTAVSLEKVKELAIAECRKANNGGSCTISYSACSMSEFRAFK